MFHFCEFILPIWPNVPAEPRNFLTRHVYEDLYDDSVGLWQYGRMAYTLVESAWSADYNLTNQLSSYFLMHHDTSAVLSEFFGKMAGGIFRGLFFTYVYRCGKKGTVGAFNRSWDALVTYGHYARVLTHKVSAPWVCFSNLGTASVTTHPGCAELHCSTNINLKYKPLFTKTHLKFHCNTKHFFGGANR